MLSQKEVEKLYQQHQQQLNELQAMYDQLENSFKKHHQQMKLAVPELYYGWKATLLARRSMIDLLRQILQIK